MIANLKPYPSMKDSGVPWLRAVPKHWGVRKLRHVLRRHAERNRPDLPLLSVVREKGVILRDTTSADENHNYIPDDLSNYKVVRAGQFAMNKMKAWQGSYGVSCHDGIVSPAYFVFEVSGVEADFFHIAIRSQAYVPAFTRASDGVRIGQWDLAEAPMRDIQFLVPLPVEQTAMVRFLNHADQRILRYIRAKQKLIALLEEQKQAIIHHAVTGQIDVRTGQPYPAYKASGVEWLREVPEHWRIRKLGQIARVFNGATPSRAQSAYWENGTVPWLNSSKVNEQVVVEPSELVTERAVRECSISLAPSGAVVLGLVAQGRTRGMSALLGIDATISQNLAAIVPSTAVDGNFLHCLLTALYLNVRNIGRGGNQEALNCDLVSRLRLPIPPLVEQIEMLRHVDSTLSKSAESIKKVKRETDLVREYRTRLIADVVTGKLDVREAAAALPEVDPIAAEDELDDTGDSDGGPKLNNEEQVAELGD